MFEKKPLKWEETTVDVGYHFEVHGFGRKVTQSELDEVVSQTKQRGMDLRKPLWRIIHVPEMEDGTSKIVIAIDHTIGDGVALVNALLFKLIDESAELSEKFDAVSRRSKRPDLPFLTRLRTYLWGTYAGHTAAFWSQDRKNPLKLQGHPSKKKLVAASKKIELARFKEVAKTVGQGVTINDVIMATFTKTIAMYFRDVAKEDSEVIKSRYIRAQFPVDTRKKKAKATEFADPNNDFGLSFLALPICDFEGKTDLILSIKQRMDKVKCSPQPLMAAKTPGRILPVLPTTTAVDVAFNAQNIATCMLSNVPGPQQQVHLAGEALDNMEFFLFGAVGMYIGIFSYNGMLSCTANMDAKIGADPHDFVRLFPVAFEEIYEGVCGKTLGAAAANDTEKPATGEDPKAQ